MEKREAGGGVARRGWIPSNSQIIPCVVNNEIKIRSLNLYHTSPLPTGSRSPVTKIGPWGENGGTDQDIIEAPRRLENITVYSEEKVHSAVPVGNVIRFKGSTLQVMGLSGEEGECAIVGGTGKFTRATGVISQKLHEQRNDGNIIELAIHAFCPLPKGSRSIVTKIGPWGGNGGTFQDITEAPLPSRLESITVCHRKLKVVISIAFSYIDHTGQKRTAGPFGGSNGESHTIPLASSEFVKEVSGTFGTYKGYNVITSLKFVTNVKPNGYGPFGRTDEEGTRFTVPVLDSSVIVGFFGRGGEYLDAVGVYVHPF